eukprot:1684637-Prymnesium_polylepis.1
MVVRAVSPWVRSSPAPVRWTRVWSWLLCGPEHRPGAALRRAAGCGHRCGLAPARRALDPWLDRSSVLASWRPDRRDQGRCKLEAPGRPGKRNSAVFTIVFTEWSV